MQAVISGRSGVALLLEGEQLRSLHAGSDDIVSRREREIPYLLGDAADLQFLEDVEVPEVAQRLELATAQADGLHLALILLDGQLSHDTRRDAADELAEPLGMKGVTEYIENVLFSHPLPAGTDLSGALLYCPGRAVASWEFLQRLRSLQSHIFDVFLAWEQIPASVFVEEGDRALALANAVREGYFRRLVLLRAEKRPVAEALRGPALPVRNHWQILREWLKPLERIESDTSEPYPRRSRSWEAVADLRDGDDDPEPSKPE